MGAGRGEGVVLGAWPGRSTATARPSGRGAARLHRAADGAGIERVLGDVVAAVDAGDHQVGRGVLEDFVEAGQHAVGGGALDGEAAGLEALEAHRPDVGDAVGDARLLEGGGDDPDLAAGAGELGGDLLGDGEAGALMPSSLVRRMRIGRPFVRRRPFLGTGRAAVQRPPAMRRIRGKSPVRLSGSGRGGG